MCVCGHFACLEAASALHAVVTKIQVGETNVCENGLLKMNAGVEN